MVKTNDCLGCFPLSSISVQSTTTLHHILKALILPLFSLLCFLISSFWFSLTVPWNVLSLCTTRCVSWPHPCSGPPSNQTVWVSHFNRSFHHSWSTLILALIHHVTRLLQTHNIFPCSLKKRYPGECCPTNPYQCLPWPFLHRLTCSHTHLTTLQGIISLAQEPTVLTPALELGFLNSAFQDPIEDSFLSQRFPWPCKPFLTHLTSELLQHW